MFITLPVEQCFEPPYYFNFKFVKSFRIIEIFDIPVMSKVKMECAQVLNNWYYFSTESVRNSGFIKYIWISITKITNHDFRSIYERNTS